MLNSKSQIILTRMHQALHGGHPAHLTVRDNRFMIEQLRYNFPGQLIEIHGEFWTVHPKRWDKNHLGPKPTSPPPLTAS